MLIVLDLLVTDESTDSARSLTIVLVSVGALFSLMILVALILRKFLCKKEINTPAAEVSQVVCRSLKKEI